MALKLPAVRAYLRRHHHPQNHHQPQENHTSTSCTGDVRSSAPTTDTSSACFSQPPTIGPSSPSATASSPAHRQATMSLLYSR
ncbi:hypothetical protein U1Q18_044331, partial [Sarracenia purpurea var. burkii]